MTFLLFNTGFGDGLAVQFCASHNPAAAKDFDMEVFAYQDGVGILNVFIPILSWLLISENNIGKACFYGCQSKMVCPAVLLLSGLGSFIFFTNFKELIRLLNLPFKSGFRVGLQIQNKDVAAVCFLFTIFLAGRLYASVSIGTAVGCS